MFAKLFTLLAMLAFAFSAPAPAPAPQFLTYSTGLDYVYPPGAVLSPAVNPYVAAPLSYSALPANPVFLR